MGHAEELVMHNSPRLSYHVNSIRLKALADSGPTYHYAQGLIQSRNRLPANIGNRPLQPAMRLLHAARGASVSAQLRITDGGGNRARRTCGGGGRLPQIQADGR